MVPSDEFSRSCYARFQCQRPALGPRLQSTIPVADVYAHGVSPAVVLLLVTIGIGIFNWVLHIVPSPTPWLKYGKLSPASLVPDTALQNRSRGATWRVIQAHLIPAPANPVLDPIVNHTDSKNVSSFIRTTGTTRVESSRRVQLGVCAGFDLASAHANTSSPSITNTDFGAARSRVRSSPDWSSCERCPGSAPTVQLASRGGTPNSVQVERSFVPPIGAHRSIGKFPFPGTLKPIEPRPDDDPSQEPSARQSQRATLRGTSLAVAAAHHAATWFILVVAVGAGLKDPEADLAFLLGAFKSPVVYLVSLLNHNATLASIRRELRRLYRKAQRNVGSRMLVYLTGLGEQSGRMCLFGGATVGAEDLKRWLAGPCAESSHARPTLGVIFDICRSAALSNSIFDHDLAIVWSCSARQAAYALGFGPGLPSSCFLNSLFLAAHDVLVGNVAFEHAFKSRLAQQGDLIRFIHRRRHDGNKTCQECAVNHPCCPPNSQESDYGQAGRDTLLALGEFIMSESPHVAHHVYAEMTRKMINWKFLGPGSRGVPHPVAPNVRCSVCSMEHSTKRQRGSTGATSQAALIPKIGA